MTKGKPALPRPTHPQAIDFLSVSDIPTLSMTTVDNATFDLDADEPDVAPAGRGGTPELSRQETMCRGREWRRGLSYCRSIDRKVEQIEALLDAGILSPEEARRLIVGLYRPLANLSALPASPVSNSTFTHVAWFAVRKLRRFLVHVYDGPGPTNRATRSRSFRRDTDNTSVSRSRSRVAS